MKKIKIMFSILLCMIFFDSFTNVYASEKIVRQLPHNGTSYTVKFENKKAMISRDGSEAIPIENNTKLTKPGTYFLALFNGDQVSSVETFTIVPSTNFAGSKWTINKESELDEILKYSLENFKKEITIQFNYGPLTFDQINTLFDKKINTLLDQYPKLTYEGYVLSALLGSRPSVRLKLSYPLQVTDTLKTYDAKTNQQFITILNEHISPNMKDYEIELTLFEFILKHITYSKGQNDKGNFINATPMSHTIYGGIIDGVAVCDGYAKSLMYLLNASGVPTKLITGNTSDGVLHAWNLVKVQGAFYHVDATWADQEEHQIGSLHTYFNEKDSYMQQTHLWDKNSYPPTPASTYTLPYFPKDFTNVYKIYKPSQLHDIFSSIYTNSPQYATVILYEDSIYKWEDKKIVYQLIGYLKKPIYYTLEKKYNCVILSFNKA